MTKNALLAFASLLVAAGAVHAAEDLDFRLLVVQEFKSCTPMDDAERLVCFDDLSERLPDMALAGVDTDSPPCTVEAWKPQMRGHLPYLTGSATCATGRLSYRLHDGETGEFLASGFTYLKGFAFQDYPDIEQWPGRVDMRHTITDR
jgi:hypothetical protein